jgi:hypothetical protein
LRTLNAVSVNHQETKQPANTRKLVQVEINHLLFSVIKGEGLLILWRFRKEEKREKANSLKLPL